MKIKKIISAFVILLIFLGIICLKNYCDYKFSNEIKSKIENNNKDSKIIQIEEIYNSKETSENSIKIIDSKGNLINTISPLENKIYEILSSDVSSLENIEYKDIVILSDIAQKANLELDDNEISEINDMVDAVIRDSNVDNDELLQKDYKNYLTNIQYYSKINERILDEISNNSLTIDDDELQNEINIYREMQEEAKILSSEEEKYEQLRKIYSKLVYIQNLYIQKLLDKYKVEK